MRSTTATAAGGVALVEARFTSTELSCAVASEHSCYLILTRQFALSHLSKPAPYRSSFFIIETVDTKMLSQCRPWTERARLVPRAARWPRAPAEFRDFVW